MVHLLSPQCTLSCLPDMHMSRFVATKLDIEPTQLRKNASQSNTSRWIWKLFPLYSILLPHPKYFQSTLPVNQVPVIHNQASSHHVLQQHADDLHSFTRSSHTGRHASPFFICSRKYFPLYVCFPLPDDVFLCRSWPVVRSFLPVWGSCSSSPFISSARKPISIYKNTLITLN